MFSLSTATCTIRDINNTGNTRAHMHVPITLAGLNQRITVAAMIDSGASTLFINRKLVEKHNIRTCCLDQPITLLNIDGTPNRAGQITHVAPLQMTVGPVTESWEFVVTDLGPEEVVLGIEWLKKMNPCVNWKEGTMEIAESTAERIDLNRTEQRLYTCKGLLEDNTNKLWTSAGYTYSQQIAEIAGAEKRARSLAEIIPSYYQDFDKVFSESESEQLPRHQPWDHSIDLKEGAPDSI
jgi:predicted aspartyl protease